MVTLHSGSGRFLHLDFGRGLLSTSTAGCIRGHNASGATNAFCVAAAPAGAAQETNGPSGPYPNSFGATNKVETFSSDGPRRVFYNSDGTAITPGNLSSSGGKLLQKPDLTAADGVSTTLPLNGGLNPFFGTSAAAPHAGAIAALLLSYRPDLTPAQIRTALVNSAVDIGTAGWDRDSGAGIIMADAALNSVDNTPPVVAVTSPPNLGVLNLLTNISGTASDVGSGLQGNQIHFTLNNNGNFWSGRYWTNTATTDPSILLSATVVNGVWAFTNVPTGVNQVQGVYYVSAYAQDNAGNTSSAQGGVTSTSFTVSTTPPAVAITFPLNAGTITNQPAGNWYQGIASGNLGISVSLTLYIRRDSDNLYWTGSGWGSEANGSISNTTNSATHVWQSTGALPVPGSSLLNGTYDFIAIARDAAGNQQQVDAVVTVNFHPVYVFNAGSYNDPNSSNQNMAWANPENWAGGGVPTPDARVIIAGYTPDSTALNGLQLYELDLSGGTLSTAGMVITNVNVTAGTLAGGVISLPPGGIFNWSGGTLGGIYNISAGATLNLTGAADKTFSAATLVNHGTVIWNGGNLVSSYLSVITNAATMVMQSSGDFSNNFLYYGSGSAPEFANNGWLQKTNSNGVTTIASDNGGWIFNQNGIIDVENGALSSQSVFNVNGGAVFSGPGETRVDAGTATLNGTNTVPSGGTVEMAGGTWNGNNVFAGSGTFVWSGGIISAQLSLLSNLTFSITGASNKYLYAGSINSGGTGTWKGTGNVECSYDSLLINSGTFTFQNDSFFDNDGTYYGYGLPVPAFVNNGSVIKNTTSGTTFFHAAYLGAVAFDNYGSVSIQSGNLSLGGGGDSSNDVFTVATGSVIDFTNGTFFVDGTQSCQGDGLERVSGGTVTFDNGTNTVGGGNTFDVDSGMVTGTGAFAGAGAVTWSGGTISATLNLQTNTAFNITGASDKLLYAGSINSRGPGTWTGSGNIECSFDSVFTNGGTFAIQCDSFCDNDGTYYGYGLPGPVFVNNGTLLKNATTGTTYFHNAYYGAVAFNNNGNVNIQSGSLSLGGGGTSTNDSFTVAAGSVVDFTNNLFFCNGNQSLSGGGMERVSGSALTFGGVTTMSGGNIFAVTAGSAGGAGVFAGAGTFSWTGGTIAAQLNLQSPMTFNISGAEDKMLYGGAINSGGTGMWTGTGNIDCSFDSIFTNSGTFTIQSDSSIDNDGTYYGYGLPAMVFVNKGDLIKNTTAGTTSFANGYYGAVAFDNEGSVNIQSGVLSLGGGGNSTNDSYTVAAGALVDFIDGAFFCDGSQSVQGGGLVRVNGGVLTFDNDTNILGSGGTFTVASGSVNGAGTFTGSGIVNWCGGIISAQLDLQTNIALKITGGTSKQLDEGIINNRGVATWTGAGAVDFGYGSVFTNSGTFTIQNDSLFGNDGTDYGYGLPQPVFVNNGALIKNTTTGITVFLADYYDGVAFANNGTVNLQSGGLAINTPYTLGGVAQLDLVLGGPTPDTQFSQETFAGAATLGGVLTVTLTNGFSPTNGQSFALLNYGSETGQFTTQQLPSLPNGLAWQLTYGDSSLSLSVVGSTATLVTNPTLLSNGHFQFTLTGPNATSAIIQSSTNLLDWTSLQTNVPFTGSLLFDDPPAVGSPMRFYRSMMQP